jgi:prevent-host-death family protein
MTTIPHRELRNQSSKILERVKNGETIDVTNNGEVAATLIPPAASPFERLLLSASVRKPQQPRWISGSCPALSLTQAPPRFCPTCAATVDHLHRHVLGSQVGGGGTRICSGSRVSLNSSTSRRPAGRLDALVHELHCAGKRRALPSQLINSVLSGINLVDVARSDLMYAAAMPGKLRSADAIHLATGIRLQVDALVAYDSELVSAAADAGLSALSPGKMP